MEKSLAKTATKIMVISFINFFGSKIKKVANVRAFTTFFIIFIQNTEGSQGIKFQIEPPCAILPKD